MRRIFLLTVSVVFLFFTLNSEIEYKVSGKVMRKGEGVKGVIVTICTANPKKELSDYISKKVQTDNNGKFVFYIPRGEYGFSFYLTEKYEEKGFYRVTGPFKLYVSDKNIANVNFNILSYREFIEINLNILKKIPLEQPTVRYKYGKIPIFSERECREDAIYYWKNEKNNEYLPDYLKNAKMGKITVYYDFRNNPAFYEYPFIYKGVEVACYGIHAIGFRITREFSRYLKIDKNITEIEFNNKIEEYRKQKLSSHYMIAKRIKVISEKENCDIKDIVIEKLICSNYGADCLKLLLNIPSKNKKYLIGLNMGYIYENSTFPFNILFEHNEMIRVYNYIVNYKNHFNLDRSSYSK